MPAWQTTCLNLCHTLGWLCPQAKATFKLCQLLAVAVVLVAVVLVVVVSAPWQWLIVAARLRDTSRACTGWDCMGRPGQTSQHQLILVHWQFFSKVAFLVGQQTWAVAAVALPLPLPYPRSCRPHSHVNQFISFKLKFENWSWTCCWCCSWCRCRCRCRCRCWKSSEGHLRQRCWNFWQFRVAASASCGQCECTSCLVFMTLQAFKCIPGSSNYNNHSTRQNAKHKTQNPNAKPNTKTL